MEKFEFIEYTAKRYGIDESLAETMVDIVSANLKCTTYLHKKCTSKKGH
jgi:hypothetical protein